MLTRACIDPFSKHQSHLFGIFKLDQILIITYSFSFIYFNLYLHKFLKRQNDQNTSQSWDNYKKMRGRNLVPAKVGVVHAIALSVTYMCKFTVCWTQINIQSEQSEMVHSKSLSWNLLAKNPSRWTIMKSLESEKFKTDHGCPIWCIFDRDITGQRFRVSCFWLLRLDMLIISDLSPSIS